MNFTLVCDLMMDFEGSIRPAKYLALELIERGHKITMVSPSMTEKVESQLTNLGITPCNLHAILLTKSSGHSVLWFESWAREAFLGLNSRNSLLNSSNVLNFSQVISFPSLVWYLQGPPSLALKDMEKELSTCYRAVYDFIKPAINLADKKLVERMGRQSSYVIANSKFCASMYQSFGIESNDIIYPPIDCQTFKPSTLSPSSDYVLTYIGKETKLSVVKKVADSGIKIKAFGSKTKSMPRDLSKHPNIEFLGRVTTKALIDLYSNALFTLFSFNHEPFGYIPVESLACGTPVVTYAIQGPSECIINDYNGWLARTNEELIQKTVDIWNEKYRSNIRGNCVKSALNYDKTQYIKKWLRILHAAT